jgi:hypothetical protein
MCIYVLCFMPAARGPRWDLGVRLSKVKYTYFRYTETRGLFRGSFDYLASPRDIYNWEYILFEPVFPYYIYSK